MTGDEIRTAGVVYLWGVAAFASISTKAGHAFFAFLWPVFPVVQLFRRGVL